MGDAIQNPPPDKYGFPGVNYPTSNPRDLLIIEDIPVRANAYLARGYGIPHERETTALLCLQAPIKGNGVEKAVRRYYANPRLAQEPYNLVDYGYEDGDSDFPFFIRSYLLLRSTYVPLALGTALTALIGLTITGGGSGKTDGQQALSFSGGGGTGAAGYADVVDGIIRAVFLTNSGSGYTSAPAVTIAGGGSGGSVTAQLQPVSAVITQPEDFQPAEAPYTSLFYRVTRRWDTVPGKAIGGEEVYNPELRVWERVFTQLVDPSAAAITPGASSVQVSALYHSTIAGLNVVSPGSGYTSIPTLAIGAPATGGTQATGTVPSLKAVEVTMVSAGTGNVIGDTFTFTGGTFSTAATCRVASMTMTAVSPLAPGSGHAIGDVLQLFGGVFSVPATFTVSTLGVGAVTPVAAGTGYAVGNTITLTGGGSTSSVAAVATVATVKAITATVAAAGTGHAIGDVVTMTGGTSTVPLIVTIASKGLGTLSVTTPGSGYLSTDVITLAGGTFTSAATVSGSVFVLTSTGINSGGTGHTVGDVVTLTNGGGNITISVDGEAGGVINTISLVSVGGLTSTSDAFTQVSSTGAGIGASLNGSAFGLEAVTVVSGGAYTAETATPTQSSNTGAGSGAAFGSGAYVVGAVTVTQAGNFTATASPMTQASTTGSGTGLQVTPSWGVLTATVSTVGSFTVAATTAMTQSATSGSGSGATFTATFGAGTGTLTTGGSYTQTTTTLTQGASTGSGIGATFNSATYAPLSLELVAGGAYTAIPSNPTATTTTGSGSGLTATLSFGLGGATVTNAGTLYRNNYTPVVVSSGNAIVMAVADTATRVLADGYVIESRLADIPGSTYRRRVYKIIPLPPTRFSMPPVSKEFPALFYILTTQANVKPSPGFDFALYDHRRGVFTGLQIDSYSATQFNDLPAVFAVRSPAAASAIFPIPNNCIHAAFTWAIFTNGIATYAERFVASTPYTIGQYIVDEAWQRQDVGVLWHKRIVWVREGA